MNPLGVADGARESTYIISDLEVFLELSQVGDLTIDCSKLSSLRLGLVLFRNVHEVYCWNALLNYTDPSTYHRFGGVDSSIAAPLAREGLAIGSARSRR